jgi:hypothetical protein
VERVELGLAHVGLIEADIRRLRAMLMLALADGSLRAQWNIVDAQRADVVILSAEQIEERVPLASDGRLVAVLVGEADRVPAGIPTLSWPIRMEDLLELLKQGELQALARVNAASSGHPPLSHNAARDDAWRIIGLSRVPIYVAPGRHQFFSTESLRTVHRFDIRNEFELAPISVSELPTSHEQPKPIVMLQWSIGLLTGALGPLPWINTSALLRLQRFPEFQILHHEPMHRRLAAAFSRPISGIDSAVELTGLGRQAVCSFVNAADLCGYLRVSERAATGSSVSPTKAGKGTKRTLAQLLRRALGIEAASWR